MAINCFSLVVCHKLITILHYIQDKSLNIIADTENRNQIYQPQKILFHNSTLYVQ